MDGKECSSTKVDVPLPPKVVMPMIMRKPGGGEEGSPPWKWIWDVWDFAKEDTDRVKFTFKVSLAVLLVSLLILFRAPYQVFGNNIIWSIITVVIMFEYTVGATFNRGFNRALGSLFAGIFALGVIQVAMSSGRIIEPYIIGFSIFFIGAVTSFVKLWPSFGPYEHGFRVTLFTYCLLIVSGYRTGNPIRTSMDRLYAIVIGAVVSVLINVLIFPVWAGEQLHKELTNSFTAVADSLEECVKKYLSDDGSERPDFSKTLRDDFPDEPAFRRCRATLNSSAKFESLASSAKWEPPHGQFRHFFYPWPEYIKVGAVLRHCAYKVMALHGCLHSEIQASYNLRCTFTLEILDVTNQAAELLRSLSKDVCNMKRSHQTNLLKCVHSSTERLQRSIYTHSHLFTSSHESYNDCAAIPSAKLSNALSFTLKDFADQPTEKYNNNAEEGTLKVAPTRADSYHETMKRQQRRLYSWPSREVDEFEDEGMENDKIPRMRALESTTALSLATFTSLLIEFVVRLEHLVDSVDELARMANFKECV